MLQNGYTPLHIAAKRNRREIAAATLKHGADANAESVVHCFLFIVFVYFCALIMAGFNSTHLNFVVMSRPASRPWRRLAEHVSQGSLLAKVLSLSGLNGVLGPLMEPEGALTVSGVMSNARGVVMVRWVRKTNPKMIKQFIYMYLQRCISASDSKHVNVISYNPHPTVNKTHPINNAESPLSRDTERKNPKNPVRIPFAHPSARVIY